MIHEFRAATIRRHGQATANNFPKRRQISLDSCKLLRRAKVHPKSGNHFIHDQQRAIAPRNFPQSSEKSRNWLNNTHICSNRLDDDRRDLVLVLREQPLDRMPNRCKARSASVQQALAELPGTPQFPKSQAPTRLRKKTIRVAVVAAFKLHNEIALRHSAR